MIDRWHAKGTAAVSLLLALSHPAVALAQPDPEPPAPSSPADRADQLHAEGLALAAQNQFEAAREKLREAFALKPAYDIAANLGAVELAGGHPRDAAEHLAFSLRTWPTSGSQAGREDNEKRLQEAKEKIATVTLTVNVTGAEVTIDGASLGEAPFPHEIYLEPGERRFEAKHAGYKTTTISQVMEAGSAIKIPLELVPETVTPPNGNTAEPMPVRYPAIIVTVAVLSAASLGAGIGFLRAGQNALDDARALEAELRAAGSCAAPCTELTDAYGDADTAYSVSATLFIAGGALALATVAYAIIDLPRPSAHAVRILPATGPSLFGITLDAAF